MQLLTDFLSLAALAPNKLAKPSNERNVQQHTLRSGNSEHDALKVGSRGQDGIPLMVEAAIVAEEEYKDTLYTGGEARASAAQTENHPPMQKCYQIDYSFFHGHTTSKPVLDGLLPVHPLVLCLPATLRASTPMMLTAACPRRRNVLSSRSPSARATSSTLNSNLRRTSSTLNSQCRTPLEVGRRTEGYLPPGGGRRDHGNDRASPNGGTHGTRGEGAPSKEGTGLSIPPLTPEMGVQKSRFTRTVAEGHARVTHGHARAEHAHANPGGSEGPGVSTPRTSSLHSPAVEPLVVGYSDEARVSEPGPGTRTLLPARPR